MKTKIKGILIMLTLLIIISGTIYFIFMQRNIQITSVWAVNDGEKILQDDLNNRFEKNNSVWDGKSINLFGAKNEIIAFQVIIEASNDTVNMVNVELPRLSNGVYAIQNSPISKGDPYNYVGKRIEFFVEDYVLITNRSGKWSPKESMAPNMTGNVPDALIPFEADSSKGGAPFNIVKGKNQAVWIDIYIPKDAPAGEYKGNLIVKERGIEARNIPVILKVYNFMIPDENHMKQWFFGSSDELQRKHGVKFRSVTSDGSTAFPGDKIEERYFQMFHRHRMDLTFNTNLSGMEKYYSKFITGRDYTIQNNYDGPGISQPHTTYSIGTYDLPFSGKGTGFYPDTKEAYWQAADEWVAWFRLNSPKTEIFRYMLDEPFYGKNNGVWPNRTLNITWNINWINLHAQWLHSNPGIGKDLMVYITSHLDPRLYDSADFWSTAGWPGQTSTNPEYGAAKQGYDLPTVATRKALGEKIGIYNSNRPFYPATEWIDNDAIDPRAMSLVVLKYNVDQYFLWEINIWNANSATGCNYCFDVPRNVFEQMSGINAAGSGEIVYPGQQKDLVGTYDDKGLEGPIASIRMKNWRRGMQDYEYFWLAKQKGINTKTQLDYLIPHAFNDYGGNYIGRYSPVPWKTRGDDYELIRKQLAEVLSK